MKSKYGPFDQQTCSFWMQNFPQVAKACALTLADKEEEDDELEESADDVATRTWRLSVAIACTTNNQARSFGHHRLFHNIHIESLLLCETKNILRGLHLHEGVENKRSLRKQTNEAS